MILAIDMGNSNIVIGGIDETNTHFMERITTDTRKTDLEYAVSLKSILDLHHIAAEELEGAILSSVVPPLNAVITEAVRKVTGLSCKLVGAGMKTGMNIRMDDPKHIGSDLIVDSVAAKANYPLPIIVIDMGTATSITALDQNGDYVGGIIHPGLRVSLNTLSGSTAQLPSIDLESPAGRSQRIQSRPCRAAFSTAPQACWTASSPAWKRSSAARRPLSQPAASRAL